MGMGRDRWNWGLGSRRSTGRGIVARARDGNSLGGSISRRVARARDARGAGRRETRTRRRRGGKTPRRETTRREMRDAEARGSMIRAWFE